MASKISNVVVLIVAATLAIGCAGNSTAETAPEAPAPSLAPPTGHEIARFAARVDHQSHTLVLERAPEASSFVAEGARPLSLDPLPYPGADPGGGAPNSVDLVTTSCEDPYPAAQTFQCNVQMVSYFTRTLANAYVTIESVTLNGSAISGYDGTNSDPPFQTSAGTLSNTQGLWSYTSPGANPAATSPMLTSKAVGFNYGVRTWAFQNTADENIVYDIHVYATEGFPTYTTAATTGSGAYGSAAYVDACTGGTSANSQTTVTLPFDFTLYNTNSTTLTIATNGQLTVGSTLPTPSGVPQQLPSTSAGVAPAFFPFWDDLVFGTSGTPGQICYQTLGSAPNRQFVVEWRNMDFASAPDQGSSLDFETFLYEGTSEIDTVYSSMVGAPGDTSLREKGAGAWVGMQDEAAATAVGSFHVPHFGSGTSYRYVPSPGCVANTATDPNNCGACGVVCAGSCTSGHCAVTLASGQSEPYGIAVAGTDVYWTNYYNGTVLSVPSTGGAPSSLASGQGHPEALVADMSGVYWLAGNNVAGQLFSTGATSMLASGQHAPTAVATDGSSLYWTSEGTYAAGFYDGTVSQIPVAGGTTTTLASAQYAPTGVCVGSAALFWANTGAKAIVALPLGVSGGNPTVLTSGTSVGEAKSVTADSGRVYWTNYASSGTVMAVATGGGTPTTLASAQSYPYAIAVDATYAYWTNGGNGTVMKVPLSGGTPTTLASGQGTPEGIAVDQTSVYWVTHGSGTSNGAVIRTLK